MTGSIRHIAAMAALACGAFGAAAFAGQEHRYRHTAPVCVHLTTRDHLSGPAARTLQEEAARIWLRHGIALTWTQPVPETCPTVASIVFDEAELLKLAGGRRDQALARTVFLGRTRTIYVSVPRAFVMLAHIPDAVLSSGGERDLRGGTLLGRVVAHELGHLLLTTLSHSQAGLMRPIFGLRDVLSADDHMTDLSPVETNRLATRFSLVPIDRPTAPTVVAVRGR